MNRHPAVLKVNESFQEGFNKWRPPRSIGMRLLMDCMRKTIRDFRATEAEVEKPDARGMDNMSYGSAYEIWMIERLKNAGLLKYGGVKGKDDQVNIRAYEGNGYMDCLCVWNGEDIATEIKTKDSRNFDRIVRERQPEYIHIAQLMAYMHFLGLEHGWLIYMDRDKHFEGRNGEIIPRWEIFEIEYDKKFGELLEKRLKKLSKYKLNPDKEPKKEPESADDPRCKYCAHRIYCWNEPSNNRPARKNAIATRIANNSQAKRRSASISKVPSSNKPSRV